MYFEVTIVEQKSLDEEYWNTHKEGTLTHIHEALVKMDIMRLAMINQPYCPNLISQFYCTVRFKKDLVRTMIWMAGENKVTSTLGVFATFLGYTWENIHKKHGYDIHDNDEYDKACLAFCYPRGLDKPKMPFNSLMYPFYNLLSKIFRHNIMIKDGDVSVVRGYMANLMFLTKPNR